MAPVLPRFANYKGLSLRMQYQFDNPTCGTYSVFESHSRDVTGYPTLEGKKQKQQRRLSRTVSVSAVVHLYSCSTKDQKKVSGDQEIPQLHAAVKDQA